MKWILWMVNDFWRLNKVIQSRMFSTSKHPRTPGRVGRYALGNANRSPDDVLPYVDRWRQILHVHHHPWMGNLLLPLPPHGHMRSDRHITTTIEWGIQIHVRGISLYRWHNHHRTHLVSEPHGCGPAGSISLGKKDFAGQHRKEHVGCNQGGLLGIFHQPQRNNPQPRNIEVIQNGSHCKPNNSSQYSSEWSIITGICGTITHISLNPSPIWPDLKPNASGRKETS